MFVPPDTWPDRSAEKARYDQHHNDPSDIRYRRFLERLTLPLVERLETGTVGLDFGSGPGPAIGSMLAEFGLDVRIYDPFYAPDESVWHRQYAFITASEVVEHLHDPVKAFDRLFGVLEPGGWLGVMTKWVRDAETFSTWRYIRDPTHVAFYCPVTLSWIATRWAAEVELVAQDVALFRKPGPRARDSAVG